MSKASSKQGTDKILKAAEAAHNQKTNADPFTGEHGAQPLGLAVGASAGAVVGAAVGAIGGPVGVLAGGAAGVIAGGIVGKQIGETLDPSVEDAYWKAEFMHRDYYVPSMAYAAFQPAYQFGWESYMTNRGRTWNQVEGDLENRWLETEPTLEWKEAKPATRDAWERVAKSSKS